MVTFNPNGKWKPNAPINRTLDTSKIKKAVGGVAFKKVNALKKAK